MEDTGSGLLISKNEALHQGGTQEKWQEKLKINVDLTIISYNHKHVYPPDYSLFPSESLDYQILQKLIQLKELKKIVSQWTFFSQLFWKTSKLWKKQNSHTFTCIYQLLRFCHICLISCSLYVHLHTPPFLLLTNHSKISWRHDDLWSLRYFTLFFSKTETFSYIVVDQWLSCVWLSATPWTVAYQASLSMEFPRHKYRGVLPFPSIGDLSSQRRDRTCISCIDRWIFYPLSHHI